MEKKTVRAASFEAAIKLGLQYRKGGYPYVAIVQALEDGAFVYYVEPDGAGMIRVGFEKEVEF